MSSALLHAAPQTTALNSSSSSARPTSSREGYHANPPAINTSRRPAPAHSPTNQYSPSVASQSNSPMSSRAAIASPVAVAPVTGPGPASEYQSDRRRHHAPPVAPPRTSSTQNQQGSSAAPPPSSSSSSSRRPVPQATNQPQSSSRRAPDHPSSADHHHQYQSSSSHADSSSSSRRRDRHHAPPPSDHPQRSGGSRDPRTAPMPSRTNQSSGLPTASSSKQPSREASEILNSVLISQPEVDIDREKERLAQAQPHSSNHRADLDDAAPPPIVAPAETRASRSRHDHPAKREKQTKFGEYILGNTIGEGEFGKVKLGWKPEGGVQVAIKLIKKDALGSNPNRMAKIMREVSILKQLTHPNIVRLHKMEESERHYGIILEYASGGELFDYILNNRYLKDNAARRLFAQLVSGVGYLHKKGIVHRDLKLENLLLDRNRNIIITDFGFANTFDPSQELSEEEEAGLSNRDFVKRMGLDKAGPSGSRKGDLMQTSCGSPCYAAPELVVSDSLYTARKVDVWSCGVILYAMLAGYLPFDDDPANPEGDNINLLYKYIVNTPLTFPEYVTPHAKDLLRRILVPDPRRRADLFEVARHSWLSEYAHVVEFITSSTTTHTEIQNTTVPAEDLETPSVARSASVRESSRKTPVSPAIGGLVTKQGGIDQDADYGRQQKDNKRRTVQVEYVAPTTKTQRGEPSSQQANASKTRARSGSQGPVEVTAPSSPKDKPLPRDPPVSKDAYAKTSATRGDPRKPPSSHQNQTLAVRPTPGGRVPSDSSYVTTTSGGAVHANRPTTGGSMNSTGSRAFVAAPRSSYGQPLPPTVAGTNVLGRIQQPTGSAKNYATGNDGQEPSEYGRPSMGVPPKFARMSGFAGEGEQAGSVGGGSEGKGHRRSNTLGEITGKMFGRSGSLFGNKGRKRNEQQPGEPKGNRRYPPVSMSAAPAPTAGDYEPRQSVESKRSRRSFSFGLGKRASGSIAGGSQTSQEKQHSRRFSFIPNSMSKAMGLGGKGTPNESSQDLPFQDPPAAHKQHQSLNQLSPTDSHGRYVDQRVGPQDVEANGMDGMYAQLQSPHSASAPTIAAAPLQQQQQPLHYTSGQYGDRQMATAVPSYMQQQGAGFTSGSDSSVNLDRSQGVIRVPAEYAARGVQSVPLDMQQQLLEAQGGMAPAGPRGGSGSSRGPGSSRGVLQKNKRFVDAYDTDEYSGRHQADHGGSSGAARKVMDFFRRRGKARGGDER